MFMKNEELFILTPCTKEASVASLVVNAPVLLFLSSKKVISCNKDKPVIMLVICVSEKMSFLQMLQATIVVFTLLPLQKVLSCKFHNSMIQ